MQLCVEAGGVAGVQRKPRDPLPLTLSSAPWPIFRVAVSTGTAPSALCDLRPLTAHMATTQYPTRATPPAHIAHHQAPVQGQRCYARTFNSRPLVALLHGHGLPRRFFP